MSEPIAPVRPTRKGKSVVARVIVYTVLGGIIAYLLVIGIIEQREEGSYTGTAEVVKSYQQKSLCTIDVQLSDGAEYSYVIRIREKGYCETFTPGATINIKNGKVTNPDGVKP